MLLLSLAVAPQPYILTAALVLSSAGSFIAYTLKIRKVDEVDLISIISPDGGVTLKSGKKTTIEGFLSGEQWSTSHITVLRYKTGGKRQQIVLLSVQQHTDDYRRLQVWLRHAVFENTDKSAVSGSLPA